MLQHGEYHNIKEQRNNKSKIFIGIKIFSCVIMLILQILYPETADSGLYLNSAHANSTYGVNRTGLSSFGYPKGHCAHCHEQHASIAGGEPDPAGGPDKYALFSKNYDNPTNANICLKCHIDTGSVQTGGLINRSYSYRAGGYTSDALNDIKEAFSNPPNISSHSIEDIKTFINGKWNYTSADSNPCTACHNPHAVQGDPGGSGSSAKTSGTRGYPVSRPSLHSKDNNSWGIWGNSSGQKMSDYSAGYQAPYRYNSTTTYEPDGSAAQNGSNLTDFVTFCTDCHNNTNSIDSSTTQPKIIKGADGKLLPIDWDNEKHGKGVSDGYDGAGAILAPYSTNKVIACVDCHEPHGAPNVTLIRKEINGGVLSGAIASLAQTSTPSNREIGYLCQRCHKDDYMYNPADPGNRWREAHHNNIDDNPNSCANGGCHEVCFSPSDCNCTYCHYHGAIFTSTDFNGRAF